MKWKPSTKEAWEGAVLHPAGSFSIGWGALVLKPAGRRKCTVEKKERHVYPVFKKEGETYLELDEPLTITEFKVEME